MKRTARACERRNFSLSIILVCLTFLCACLQGNSEQGDGSIESSQKSRTASVGVVENPKATVIWEFDVDGIVACTPGIDDTRDRVVFCTTEKDAVCLDMSNGYKLWELPLDDVVISTPTFDRDGNCYVSGWSKALYCIDVQGDLIWTLDMRGNTGESPKVFENVGVVCTYGKPLTEPEQGAVALISQDGSVIWEVEFSNLVHRSICVGPDNEIIVAAGKVLHCLDLEGLEIWNKSLQGEIASHPALVDNRIVVTTNTPALYIIEPTGQEVQEYSLQEQYQSQAVPIGDNSGGFILGSIDGYLVSFSLNGEINWRSKVSESIIDSVPYIGSDQSVYFASIGSPVILALDAHGKEQWRFSIAEGSNTSIVGQGTCLYLGDGLGWFYLLEIK